MTKQCTKCNNIKELDQFNIDSRVASGLQNVCRICRNRHLRERYKLNPKKGIASSRLWQAKNPEKVEDTQLKRRYGITLDQKKQLLNDQGHSCPLCLRHQEKLNRPLMVDHCHKTKKVRELLCFTCNTALGLINDDINIALRLVQYIQRYSTDKKGDSNGSSN